MPQEVCLVFLMHHPERLRHVRVFDSAADFGNYVDDRSTTQSLRELARLSFLPALKLLREAIEAGGGHPLRVGICPSGALLRSAERHYTPLLRAMQRLNDLKAVEWIAAPWDGSILSILPGDHLVAQLREHGHAIERLFGQRPTTAANTDLIYDNHVARQAAAAGMKLVLCGYADPQLGGRTANHVYRAAGGAPVQVMARNVGLSDDWGVRYGDPSWPCHPLKAETYADWILGSLASSGGSVCPIMIHLADLGRTHAKESHIFSFTKRLLGLLGRRGVTFLTPGQAAERAGALQGLEVLDVPQATSGWGPAFDLSPWLGNAMQSNALHLLRRAARAAAGDPAKQEALDRLRAADHLAHMRFAPPAPGAEERRRPSPFESPYDAYLDLTNALHHLLGDRAGENEE